jgi:hypothetical protein
MVFDQGIDQVQKRLVPKIHGFKIATSDQLPILMHLQQAVSGQCAILSRYINPTAVIAPSLRTK